MGGLRFIEVDPRLEPPGVKAAAYYRMSTDGQQLSIELQQRAVEAYCATNGLRIIQSYADEGRSGLTLRGRPGLRSLLEDVQRGPDYRFLVVYDVSRWGRFQDTDESAYYDYLCRQAGVPVIYCAEPFTDDASPMAALMKTVKRIMAAEFSRELSTKVFLGQCRTTELGFRVCGPAMYGFRRLLVGSDGAPKALLLKGESKHVRTERVVLVPGPPNEVATVRRIFHLYVDKRMTVNRIVHLLNDEGVPNHLDRPWGPHVISRMLANPNYAGHLVFNRTTRKLKTKHRLVPREHWVWSRDAFEPIVEPKFFDKTQRVIHARSGDMTKDQMLAGIRRIRKVYGRLSETLIAADDETPSVSTFKLKFGSLREVYRLAGYLSEGELGDLHAANMKRFNVLRVEKKLVRIDLRRTVKLRTQPHHPPPPPPKRRPTV